MMGTIDDDDYDSDEQWGESIHHLDHAPSGHSLSVSAHHPSTTSKSLRARAYSAGHDEHPSGTVRSTMSGNRARLWSSGSSPVGNSSSYHVPSSSSFPPLEGKVAAAASSSTNQTAGSGVGILKHSMRGPSRKIFKPGGGKRKQTLFGGAATTSLNESAHSRASFSQRSYDYFTDVLSPHGGAAATATSTAGDESLKSAPSYNKQASAAPPPSPPLSTPSPAAAAAAAAAGTDSELFVLHRAPQHLGDASATRVGGTPGGEALSPQSSFYSETTVPGLGEYNSDIDFTSSHHGYESTAPPLSSSEYTHHHHRHRQPLVVCGFELPAWCSCSFSWTHLSTLVVTKAPCFWCGCLGQHFQATDRAILQRLNILCCFISLFQLASAMFLAVVLLFNGKWDRQVANVRSDILNTTMIDEAEGGGQGSNRFELLTNLWFINSSVLLVGALAIVIFLSNILTVPMIRSVNILGAIRYLWAVIWLMSFETHFVIGMFDYFRVTKVWIKHWWRDETLGVFRKWYCNPSSTSNTLCTPPVLDETGVDEWCMELYNSTDCYTIQTNAQSKMATDMLAYYYANAVIGLIMIALLLLVINNLESIISRPIVQKSRESNLAGWFALPFCGCLGIGTLFAFSNQSVLSTRSGGSDVGSWIGLVYIIAASLFLLAALLGWFIGSYSILNARDKRYKLAAIILFILVTAAIFASLCTIFIGSILFSTNLVGSEGSGLLTDEERWRIACFIDQSRTCTGCENRDVLSELGLPICPEWTTSDVTKILQTQAKASATLSAIFLMYAGSALRFGFSMRKNIMLYQIDYV